MKIIPNYDFTTASGSFTPADEASFEEDVRTAINIFDATFTNDITLTLDIGFGSIGTETLVNGVPTITHSKMNATEGGLGSPSKGRASSTASSASTSPPTRAGSPLAQKG